MASRLSKQQFKQDPPRAKWTMYLTKTLADLMVEQVRKGNKKNNLFEKKAWTSMCADFHSKTGLKWDKEQLRSRYTALRRQYTTVKSLLDDERGFHWDENERMVIATNEVWDEYIKAHPDAEAIRTNGCPIYKQLCIIFSESGAKESNDKLNDSIELDEEAHVSFDVPVVVMPIHSTAPSVFVPEDTSLSTEDDDNIGDAGNKHQSATSPTPTSARRKRNTRGTEDVIAKALLEIASASKLRAAAVMRNGQQFSITNCVHILDELEGINDNLYYAALDLFDSPTAREMFLSLKSDKRLTWLKWKLTSSVVIA